MIYGGVLETPGNLPKYAPGCKPLVLTTQFHALHCLYEIVALKIRTLFGCMVDVNYILACSYGNNHFVFYVQILKWMFY